MVTLFTIVMVTLLFHGLKKPIVIGRLETKLAIPNWGTGAPSCVDGSPLVPRLLRRLRRRGAGPAAAAAGAATAGAGRAAGAGEFSGHWTLRRCDMGHRKHPNKNKKKNIYIYIGS